MMLTSSNILGRVAGGAGLLAIAGVASGDFTGFDSVQTVVSQDGWQEADPRSLVIVDIYATFDNAGDQLLAVSGNVDNALSIATTDGSGFYQSPGSVDLTDTLNSALFGITPSLAADSWVTITNTDQTDNNLLNIGIDFAGFNNGDGLDTANGAWLVTQDDLPQGAPVDGAVLIGRFTVAAGSTVSGSVNITIAPAEGDSTTLEGQTFEFVTEGDGGDGGGGNDAIHAVKSDFDGDGISDILWQDAYDGGASDGRMISWQQWNGNDLGYATAWMHENAIDASEQFLWAADMNADGRVDLVWQNATGVYAWLMDGWTIDSNVWISTEDMTGWEIVAIADIDADGVGDLVWQDSYNDDALNDGRIKAWTEWDGTDGGYVEGWIHEDPIVEAAGLRIGAAADMDGDDDQDLLLQDAGGVYYVWLMDGTSYVEAAMSSDVVANALYDVVAIADVDGDGIADLIQQDAYGDGEGTDGAVQVLRAWDGTDGGFTTEWIYNGEIPEALGWVVSGSGDYDGDGSEDIIWRDGDGSVICWLMDGASYDNGFLYSGAIPGWEVLAPNDLFLSDEGGDDGGGGGGGGGEGPAVRSAFDGDGICDLLWQDAHDGGGLDGRMISWQQWDGSDRGYATAWVHSGAIAEASEIVGAIDMDGDGHSDIIWDKGASGVSVWTMDGWSYTEVTMSNIDMNGWRVAAVGDFDGDGLGDILWQDEYDGSPATDGRLKAWMQWDGSMNGYIEDWVHEGAIAEGTSSIQGAGDFDGDGDEDLLLTASDGSVQVWTMNGWTPTFTYFSSGDHSAWDIKAIGDVDGDGIADVVLQDAYDGGEFDGRVKVWTEYQDFGGGDTGFTEGFLFAGAIPEGLGWIISGSGDYDGDGNDDLIWRDGDGSVICWRNLLHDGGSGYQTGWLYSGSIAGWNIEAPADVYAE